MRTTLRGFVVVEVVANAIRLAMEKVDEGPEKVGEIVLKPGSIAASEPLVASLLFQAGARPYENGGEELKEAAGLTDFESNALDRQVELRNAPRQLQAKLRRNCD